MVDPLFALGVFFALVLVTAVLVWPGRGVLARVSRVRRETERVRLEDGLKHLLDAERAGRPSTLETLAGRLEVSRGVASEVLTRLTGRGLAVSTGEGFEMTEAGRSYALRIVRTHRLWERYLADRTGVPAGEWHARAEDVEHYLSEAEAEALATRLGDPRYDPHGDPIPTSSGEIPDRLTGTISGLAPGDAAVVRHVEDEPWEVFDRLTRMGLAPGRMLEVVAPADGDGGGADDRGHGGGSGRVRIRVRGQEHELGPVEASHVTVERVPAAEAATGGVRTLADAARGETVRVTGISPACQGPQRRRLLDLGVVPGTPITAELVSTAGDPVAYRIRGALIALRREQAGWIEVEADAVERAS